MHQNESKHFLMQVAVEREGLPQEVVYRGYRFDTGKSATRHNKSEQGLALPFGTVGIRLFQVSDQPISPPRLFIVIARSAKPGRLWKFGIVPSSRISLIVTDGVGVTLEAVRQHQPAVHKVDVFHFSGEELNVLRQLSNRVNDQG